MSRSTIADAITATETLAGELAEQCLGDALAIPCLVGLGLDELVGLIEALPPGTPNMELYRNRARSSRALWEGGEGPTAGYQLTQLHRRLGQLKEKWS